MRWETFALFLLCIAQFINIVSFNAIKYQPIPSLNWREFIKAFDPHIICVLSFTVTGVYKQVEKFMVGCFPRARAFRLNGLRNAWTSHCSNKMFVIKMKETLINKTQNIFTFYMFRVMTIQWPSNTISPDLGATSSNMVKRFFPIFTMQLVSSSLDIKRNWILFAYVIDIQYMFKRTLYPQFQIP